MNKEGRGYDKLTFQEGKFVVSSELHSSDRIGRQGKKD